MLLLTNTKGPIGGNNNCFINCLLLSLFIHKKSPLWKLNLNNEIYIHIFNSMVNILLRDSLQSLDFIRRYLPDYMKYGQQDVIETYIHLAEKLKFEPISVEYYTENMDERGDIYKGSKTKNKVSNIFLSNNENDNIDIIKETFYPSSWIDLGPSKENHIRTDQGILCRYTRTVYEYIKGDMLVYTINRTSINGKLTNIIKTPSIIQSSKGETYIKYASIIHIGQSLEGGHYVTIVHDSKNKLKYIYDDSILRNINNSIFINSNNNESIERNVVMVFYMSISSSE